jgi:hypothetical protein
LQMAIPIAMMVAGVSRAAVVVVQYQEVAQFTFRALYRGVRAGSKVLLAVCHEFRRREAPSSIKGCERLAHPAGRGR